jgi:hypothetical protein
VDYHEKISGALAVRDEVREWEGELKAIVTDVIKMMTGGKPIKFADALFKPIICLATRHKHRGFHEECEVRIVAIDLGKEYVATARLQGDKRQIKQVHFRSQSGLLVPYVKLFERTAGEAKLPIKKVVVGPHPDKLKRKRSVEMLLKQHNIDAPAVVSNIPYLGR